MVVECDLVKSAAVSKVDRRIKGVIMKIGSGFAA